MLTWKTFCIAKGAEIIHMTVRSILLKTDYIKVWAQPTNLDTFVISQTWQTCQTKLIIQTFVSRTKIFFIVITVLTDLNIINHIFPLDFIDNCPIACICEKKCKNKNHVLLLKGSSRMSLNKHSYLTYSTVILSSPG